jgi:hypothetical protein
MLRLFFGLFDQGTDTNWWDVFGHDNALPQFQWGKSTTLATKTITATKRHTPFYNYPPVIYDEYIDLELAQLDKENAEFFAQFINQAGIATPYPIVPSTLTCAVPNKVNIDGDVGEWINKQTRLLSMPFPPTGDPVYLEHFWAVNETLENDPTLPITGYMSFAAAVNAMAGIGIAADPCIVPYNTVGDTIRLVWWEPVGDVQGINIYRAPVVVSEVPQKFLNWPQWGNWRLVHNHLIISLEAPTGSNSYGSVYGAYADEDSYPYIGPASIAWGTFKPLNNALARMNLAWQRRVVSSNYMPLVINTDSMTYWKGYLIDASACFETGISVTGDKSAQFTLAVTESGFCTIDALTAPNTSANFTAITRTL